MKLEVQSKSFDKFRWVSLIAGTIIMMTCSWSFTWSLMVNPMIAERGATDAYMAAIYSAMSITGMIFTVIGGKVINMIGSRKTNIVSIAMFLVGMVLSGITANLWVFAIANILFITWQGSVIYLSVQNTAAAMFPDHRGLAMGVTTAGVSLGGMIISPVTQGLIDTIGFSAMFFVIGIAMFVITIVCSFLNPDVPEGYTPEGMEDAISAQKKKEGEKAKRWMANPNFVQKGYLGMFKDVAFYMLFAIILLCVTGQMLLSYQMSFIAQDILGIPAMQAAFLVTGVTACGFAAKIVGGALGDAIGRLKWLAIVTCLGTVFIAGLIFAGDHDLTWFAVCCFGYCFCIGAVAGMTGAVTGDLFGSENFGGNFSVVYMGVLIASTISPWLAVVGRTAEGGPNYQPIFILCTVMCAVGACIAVAMYFMRRDKTEFIPRKGNEALLAEGEVTVDVEPAVKVDVEEK